MDDGVGNVGEGHITRALHPSAVKGHADAVVTPQRLRAVGGDACQVVLTQAGQTDKQTCISESL